MSPEETIIMKSNGYTIEKLTNGNYPMWKQKIELILIKEKLWSYVTGDQPSDPDEAKAFQEKSLEAYATIKLAIEDNLYSKLSGCQNAKEAWHRLQQYFEKSSIVNTLQLDQKLLSLKFHDGMNLEEFIAKLEKIVAQLDAAGEPVSEKRKVNLILNSLPDSYSPLIMGLEIIDCKKLTFDYVTSKVLFEYTRRNGQNKTSKNEEKAFYSKNNSNNGKKWNKSKNSNNWKNWNKNNNNYFNKNSSGTIVNDENRSKFCTNCKMSNHNTADCRRPKQQEKSANYSNSNENNNYSKNDLHFAFSAITEEKMDRFYIDSGATRHLTGYKSLLENFETVPDLKIFMANQSYALVTGKGDITVDVMANGKKMRQLIKDVYYIENLNKTLVSVPVMTAKGLKINFTGSKCKISNPNGELLAEAYLSDGLYNLTPNLDSVNIAHGVSKNYSDMIWHHRFGHVPSDSLSKTKSAVTGMKEILPENEDICTGCVNGKSHVAPFPTTPSNIKSEHVLDLIHSDVWGPARVNSIGGSKYYLTFTDDYSKYTWIYFLTSKDQVLRKYEEFDKMITTQLKRKIKVLRSDNGCEYRSKAFDSYLVSRGTKRQFTIPHSPQKNGVAERINRTILEKARSILKTACLGKEFWAEAAHTSVYLYNRTIKSKMDTTSYQKIFGQVPDVGHLKIFGCVCYNHIDTTGQDKLENRVQKCLFVGYPDQHKGYRLWNITKQKIVVGRSVTFDERSLVESKDQKYDNTIHINVPEQVEQQVETNSNNASTNQDDTNTSVSPEYNIVNVTLNDTEPEYSDPNDSTFIGPNVSIPAPAVIRRSARIAGSTQKFESLQYCMTAEEDPTSYKQALNSKDSHNWKLAIDIELKSLDSQQAWIEESLPKDRKTIGSKWVFRKKMLEDGRVDRYKARLVAKGFNQIEGIDFCDTFAPTAKYSSIRTILSIAAIQDLELHQVDFVTAFLNEKLKETIYLALPDGYTPKSGNCLRLLKGLYGLKQSGHLWNTGLHNLLTSLDFSRSEHDWSIYSHSKKKMLISIYVDDMIIACKSLADINWLKSKIKDKYDIKDMGELKWILGILVERKRDDRLIYLSQENYAARILDKFGMSTCKPVSTPVETSYKEIAESEKENESLDTNHYPFRDIVGSIMYAMIATRPDLAFAVSLASKHSSVPTLHHWKLVQRILRYIQGTKNYKLKLGMINTGNTDKVILTGYCDADFANSPERKSVSGYVFNLNGGTITWASRRQPTVSLSTAEAEYVSLASAVQEAMWLRGLLNCIGHPQHSATIIKEDNTSCMLIATSPKQHSRTKHIDIKYHFLRNAIKDNIIVLEYCPSESMLADVFTKSLARTIFEKNINWLNIGPYETGRVLNSVSTEPRPVIGLGIKDNKPVINTIKTGLLIN